jgi:hypothetical protein
VTSSPCEACTLYTPIARAKTETVPALDDENASLKARPLGLALGPGAEVTRDADAIGAQVLRSHGDDLNEISVEAADAVHIYRERR